MNTNIKFEKTKIPYKGGVFKKELIQLRGHQCEGCGLSKWQN